MRAMPKKHRHVRVAMENIPNVSLDDVEAAFMREELADEDGTTRDQLTVAMHASNSKKSQRPSIECFYCKKPGHKESQCRKKKRDKQQKEDKKSDDKSSSVAKTKRDGSTAFSMMASSNDNEVELGRGFKILVDSVICSPMSSN